MHQQRFKRWLRGWIPDEKTKACYEFVAVLDFGANQGIRLVSGSGLLVFLSNPLKLLPLRLAVKRDLE